MHLRLPQMQTMLFELILTALMLAQVALLLPSDDGTKDIQELTNRMQNLEKEMSCTQRLLKTQIASLHRTLDEHHRHNAKTRREHSSLAENSNAMTRRRVSACEREIIGLRKSMVGDTVVV